MLPEFNKDFYSFIPKWMMNQLDALIAKYSHESWFEEAWYAYRDMCLSKPIRNVPGPETFFEEFHDTEVLTASATEDDMGEVLTAVEQPDSSLGPEDEELILDGEIIRNAEDMGLDIPDEPSTDEFTFVGTCEPNEKE